MPMRVLTPEEAVVYLEELRHATEEHLQALRMGIDALVAYPGLAEFGAKALHILESHKDWNGDTFQEIVAVADNLGLADNDEDGRFRWKKPRKEGG